MSERKSVAFLGHSWCRRFEGAILDGVIAVEKCIDSYKHQPYFFFSAGGGHLYMIHELEENLVEVSQRIKSTCDMVEVLVVMLGANDVAEYPGEIKKWARVLIKCMYMLYFGGAAKKVVFLEVGPRFFPNGFSESNTEYLPVDGVTTCDDGEALYAQNIKLFNDVIHQEFKPHPDCYVIYMAGMQNMRPYMRNDGKHLNDKGLRKCFGVMKREVVRISNKDSWYDLPAEMQERLLPMYRSLMGLVQEGQEIEEPEEIDE